MDSHLALERAESGGLRHARDQRPASEGRVDVPMDPGRPQAPRRIEDQTGLADKEADALRVDLVDTPAGHDELNARLDDVLQALDHMAPVDDATRVTFQLVTAPSGLLAV